MAARLYDEFHESEISQCADGSYMFTAKCYSLSSWTFSRLLSYGKHVNY